MFRPIFNEQNFCFLNTQKIKLLHCNSYFFQNIKKHTQSKCNIYINF